MSSDPTRPPATYASPRWSAEIADCSMPLVLDTYSLCSYGCLYCFSTFQRDTGPSARNFRADTVQSVNVERIKKLFTDPESAGAMGRLHGAYIRERRVMQWGGLSDQFDEHERQHGVTLELMRFFREIEYPLSFSTKATWWLDDERYRECLRGSGWHLKVSIITLNEAKARMVEVDVDTPLARLRAIERARELIDNVTLRLRPFIIGITTPRHVALIEAAAERGADSVSTEFLCLEGRSRRGRDINFPRLGQIAGYDLLAFYKKHSRSSGYQRLNREIKRPYVDEMHEACDRLGLRFYVSDSDFKERCAGGSCCGLPDSMPWSRGQWTMALLIAKERGSVRWSDIGPQLDLFASAVPADSVKTAKNNSVTRARWYGRTMSEFLRSKWNTPTSKGSPYWYFDGVLAPAGVDDEGNTVYVYDESRA